MENHDLSAEFARYFEIVRADTPELRKAAFQLRYQVYCLENRIAGFDAADYPAGEEVDDHDGHSLHVLLIHRHTGTVAGTVRLIMADPSDPLWTFPIEEHAGLLNYAMDPPPQREKIAEISRFILAARFRSRRGESLFPDGLADAPETPPGAAIERRHLLHPVLGLFKACVDLSWENGISFWYAGMEPRLQRHLDRFGVGLNEVAKAISYHGKVNAYLSSCAEVMNQCRAQRPEVWRFLTDDGRVWSLNQGRGARIGLPASPPAVTERLSFDDSMPLPLRQN